VPDEQRERKLAADRERQRKNREARKERVRLGQEMEQRKQWWDGAPPMPEEDDQPVIASDMSAIGQAAMTGNGAVVGQHLIPLQVPPLAPVDSASLAATLLAGLPATYAPVPLIPVIVKWVQDAEEIRRMVAREAHDG
jgi:hypothetical protein